MQSVASARHHAERQCGHRSGTTMVNTWRRGIGAAAVVSCKQRVLWHLSCTTHLGQFT